MGSRWGSNVPLIGKSLNKFGMIGDMLAQPCTPSPELWVKASFTGLAHAIWSAAKPSALSPHGSPTSMSVFGKHGRTNPKGSIGPRYRMNGELIPGPEIQWPTGEGWSMWKIPVMLARTAGWYLLIFDAAANGFVYWTSTAYKWAGCPIVSPTTKILWGNVIDDIIAPNQHGAIWTLNPYFNNGINFAGDTLIVPSGGYFVVGASLSCRKTLGLPFSAAKLTIIHEETGETWHGSEPKPRRPGSSTLQTSAVARGTAPHVGDNHVRFLVEGGGEWCNWMGSSIYIQATPFDNLLADP